MKVKVGDKVFEAPSWRGALGDALAARGKTPTTVNQRLRAVADLMAGRDVQIASIIIKPVKEGR